MAPGHSGPPYGVPHPDGPPRLPNSVMKHLALPLILATAAAPVAAQFSLPAPNLLLRTAPRATWTSVTSAGLNTTGTTFRVDNPGAASNDRIYVFGGCLNNNTSTTLNDLWAFDGVAGTFTQLHNGTSTTAPHARGRAAIAFNSSTNRLVVFGGDNRASGPLPADTLLGDTWEYDVATNTWANVTPAGANPSPRRWASMAHDPITGGMLLFGGETAGGTVNSDTWLFLGGSWVPLATSTVPPARRMASLVTRAGAPYNDVVMLGGDDNSLTSYGSDVYRHLDVWKWNGGDWVLLSQYDWATSTGTFPASAMANQAVYDPLRDRIVLQGGQGIAANTSTNTTYLFGTTTYNGSPTNYTSEFDCETNTWSIYTHSTAGTTPYNNSDPQIGRISRYFGGYLASTGKVYKLCGQNGAISGAKPVYSVYAYQANPVAAVASYGAGCTGPGGALSLSSAELPWTGRTWNANCSTLGPASLGLVALGLTQASLPLIAVFPFAGAGCDLLNSGDLLVGPVIPVGGAVGVAVPVPNDASIAGTVLHAQVAELEFDAFLNWVGVYTSNGLTITVGAL